MIIKPDDKSVLFEFLFSEIESLLLDPSDDFITLNLVKTDVDRQRVRDQDFLFKEHSIENG